MTGKLFPEMRSTSYEIQLSPTGLHVVRGMKLW